MKSELCSVIMPAYNAEKYIGEAITSVLNQTYTNIELLVVDDCSVDGTREVLHEYVEADSRVKLICNERNIGCAESRNRAMMASRGKYIAFLDSDDVWEAEKLALQIKILERADCDVLYTSYRMVDEFGCVLRVIHPPLFTNLKMLLTDNVICLSSVLLRGEVARRHKMLKEYFHEDYCYWLCLLQEGRKFLGLSDVLVNYRVSNQGRSSDKYNAALYRWKIYREYLGMSVFASCRNFLSYVFYGIKKHL